MGVLKKNMAGGLFVLFLFCAVFTPDFFPFSMRYLIIILCALGIGWRWIRTGKVVMNKRFLMIFRGFVPFLIWFAIAQTIHVTTDPARASVYWDTFIHTLEIFLAGFIIGLFFIYVCEDNMLEERDVLQMLMIITLIQFVCVILALLFPGIRYFFNSFIIRNSYSQRLAQLARASSSGSVDRSYGLSNNLFDSFGFITAVLISMMFITGLESKNSKLKIASILMMIMPLVNARTGVVLVVVGIVVGSVFYLSRRNLINMIGIVVLGTILFVFVISRLPDAMVSWLTSGLLETHALFGSSGITGVYSKIFGTDLIYPSSILLGDGGLPKNLISYGVDNGYINCLWNFGLVGSLLLFGGYVNMFRMGYYASESKMNKAISAVLGTIFFLYLIKVYSLDNFGGIVLEYGMIAVILTRGSETNAVPVNPMERIR